MRILVPHLKGDLAGTLSGTAQKLLGMFHTDPRKIFDKCLSDILAEKSAEMISADIGNLGDSVKGHVFVHIMCLYVFNGIFQNIPVLVSGIFIPDLNGLLQHILCVSHSRLHRRPALFQRVLRIALLQSRGAVSHPVQKRQHGKTHVQDHVAPEYHGSHRFLTDRMEIIPDKIPCLFFQTTAQEFLYDRRIHGVDIHLFQISAVILCQFLLLQISVIQDMSVIQISSGVSLRRRIIAVLHIAETFHKFSCGDKPGLSRRRVRQYLPDTLHTVPGIFARIIFLFFHKNAVAEHIVAEQHGVTVIRKKAFYFFQGPCFPFRIGFALSCRCVFGFQGKDQDIVRLRHNIQPQLVCSFVHLAHIHGPADKPFEEIPAAVLLVFLHFSVELLVILPLALLVLVSAPYLAQPFQKSVLGDRLQEIILHADADGLFRVIKIVIAAEDHDFDIRKFLFYNFA